MKQFVELLPIVQQMVILRQNEENVIIKKKRLKKVVQGNSNPNNELIKLCHDKQGKVDDVTTLFLEAYRGVNWAIRHFNLSFFLFCFITEAPRNRKYFVVL